MGRHSSFDRVIATPSPRAEGEQAQDARLTQLYFHDGGSIQRIASYYASDSTASPLIEERRAGR